MKIVDEMGSLVYEGKTYTYNDICYGCSKWLSLINRWNTDEKKVLIMGKIDEKVFFLILALLSTNSAYVPVDVKMPRERVNSIVSQVKPDLVVTEEKYADFFAGENLFFFENYDSLFPEELFRNAWGEGLAYCIFTSGSTGKPKGVMIDKNAFQSFILGTNNAIVLTECHSVLCITSISFDIFGFESIYALNQGKIVFLANEAQRSSPRLLKNFIMQNNIECVQMTPSRLKLFLCADHSMKSLQNVKVIIVGGEDFPIKLLTELRGKLKARIYNAYGPSEATIWVSYSELTNNVIDIGAPILGTRFYILNELGDMVKENTVGELYIGGSNLACGYLANEMQTEAKFVYSEVCQERVYRTGDLCKKLDGKYYWMGRLDNQVKIQGYRIEMEEIEKVIKMYEGVADAVVYLHKDDDTTKQYLVAVIIPNISFDENGYRKHLIEYLPKYMIPQCTKYVEQFSYTTSGKVDRKSIRQSIEK